MSEAKHTPGPWKLFHVSHGRDKWTIAVLKAGTKDEIVGWTGFDSSDFQKNALANARLIAAAPELLEALEKIRSLADGISIKVTWTEILAMTDAAIAKARG